MIFALKMLFFLFLFIWIRWTLPRFRYDQLMSLGWKFMLPMALAYIVVIATAIWVLHDRLGSGVRRAFRARAVRGELVLDRVLDRGRISPATARPRIDGCVAGVGRSSPKQATRWRSA